MNKRLLTSIISIALSSPALADSPSYPVSTTDFTAGTPAVADDVNANFATLVGAVNDLHDRVADLEKKDDGSLCGSLTDGHLAENTVYKLMLFNQSAGIQDNDGAASSSELIMEVEKADICLGSNGNFEIAFHLEKEGMLESYTEASVGSEPYFAELDYQAKQYSSTPNYTDLLTGTYAVTSGCRLDITPTGESVVYAHGTPDMHSFIGVQAVKEDICSTDSPCTSGDANDIGDAHFQEIFVLTKKGTGGQQRCSFN